MNKLEAWLKSSYSANVNQNCVEVAPRPTGTAIRDSKHPTCVMLFFAYPEWTAFLRSVKEDEV